jgi:SAM-dependent methyltransferase
VPPLNSAVRRLLIAVLYDTIGIGYAARRQPDPRIVDALGIALTDSDSIANIGAGAGSYELLRRTVVAIEPSMEMVRQRQPGAAPAVQASAECLPLRDNCVSAATAILTTHHWTNLSQGLNELGRIARDRVVILTWDPDAPAFWLTGEYFPAMVERDRRRFPKMSSLSDTFGKVRVQVLPVPHDCIDGFLGAYWRRPLAYLDSTIRSGMSGFTGIAGVESGLTRLKGDLESGEWARRFGHLMNYDTLDIGYRLAIAELQ